MMQTVDDEIKIVPLAEAHLRALAECVRLNDSSLPELMLGDVRTWFSKGEPRGEAYWTALHRDTPVGMTGYQPDRWGVLDIAWLVWLFVHPTFKRRGIASALFSVAQTELRRRGYRKVYLDVGNANNYSDAIAFHVQDGFVQEGVLKDYWQQGEDFLIFGKVLIEARN